METKETAALELFTVTLNWNPRNLEEGDYSVNVWAADPDEAIRLVAEEMADHSDSGVEEGDEGARSAFIENVIEGAGTYAAVSVCSALPATLQDLLKGPGGDMSPEAQRDYEQLMTLLAPYGVGR